MVIPTTVYIIVELAYTKGKQARAFNIKKNMVIPTTVYIKVQHTYIKRKKYKTLKTVLEKVVKLIPTVPTYYQEKQCKQLYLQQKVKTPKQIRNLLCSPLKSVCYFTTKKNVRCNSRRYQYRNHINTMRMAYQIIIMTYSYSTNTDRNSIQNKKAVFTASKFAQTQLDAKRKQVMQLNEIILAITPVLIFQRGQKTAQRLIYKTM
eukprot:TRINITY_DN9892_c0_g1_i1.p3 TRINITY_DN9892_c0_g1~~TRINITY_DN9892_c0_g1_i1.p3  ORF type:complete len:205 (-),score=-4.83 TRINITY_DN9892_c0_g1_i1:942-1556(-)